MLALVNVLQHPEIDALMVVRCQEFLLNAVDALVGDDDDVQEVVVKAFEEFEMREDEKESHNREEHPARECISNADAYENCVSDDKDKCIPTEELQ